MSELNPQIEKSIVKTVSSTFEVFFTENDTRDPQNFSKCKKWTITILALIYTFLASAGITAYNMGLPSMMRDLQCTELEATLGLSLYALSFGVVPLFTSAFSEEFGRYPLYLGSTIGFSLMHLMLALAPNMQSIIAGRLLQGAFGSTGINVAAGTITDIWNINERGLPMTLFAVIAFVSDGVAADIGGWIEMNLHLQWRWIQWIFFIISTVYTFIVAFMICETRSAVLLSKIVKHLQKERGDTRYHVKDQQPKLRDLLWISLTRPVYLLCTEPIVMCNSLWLGFAWGVYYVMIESIPAVYRNLYRFNDGEIGNVFLTMAVGGLLGFFTNMYQERLYLRYRTARHAEAKLYLACLAGIIFPASMILYAWTARQGIHWISSVVGITMYIWATFTIYVTVFSYLADCYGPYASSALAGQTLFRNLIATAFPLFVPKMYSHLTYVWGNTLFACIAVLMCPIPYVMFLYGPAIRQRSFFSREVTALSGIEEDWERQITRNRFYDVPSIANEL